MPKIHKAALAPRVYEGGGQPVRAGRGEPEPEPVTELPQSALASLLLTAPS